jgi:hypothetical protein
MGRIDHPLNAIWMSSVMSVLKVKRVLFEHMDQACPIIADEI